MSLQDVKKSSIYWWIWEYFGRHFDDTHWLSLLTCNIYSLRHLLLLSCPIVFSNVYSFLIRFHHSILKASTLGLIIEYLFTAESQYIILICCLGFNKTSNCEVWMLITITIDKYVFKFFLSQVFSLILMLGLRF